MFDFATAEYSAVGCFLIDSRCLPTIRERISTPEAFASEPCRKAFTAACKLADNGKPVDPVTVGREAGLDNAFLVDCMETFFPFSRIRITTRSTPLPMLLTV